MAAMAKAVNGTRRVDRNADLFEEKVATLK
jgi:hypothetical protein